MEHISYKGYTAEYHKSEYDDSWSGRSLTSMTWCLSRGRILTS